MKRVRVRWGVLSVLGLVMVGPGFATGDGPPPTRVLIPFDFESKFDDGRYGQMVGDLIWQKLKREGTFILPESMQDVRDWSERTGKQPDRETPLEEMKRIVLQEQGGELAIWGQVERVPGNEFDVYDLWIKVADFSVDPPRLIYEKQARTQTISEIPHVYVKEALDRLHGRPASGALADQAEGDAEPAGPNLVSGDFDQGRMGPQGWDKIPAHAAWVASEGGSAPGKMIRFSIPREVAETTGVLFYSDFFPVEEGATYRFRCRWRSTGTAAKVFIKAYDEFPGNYQEKPVAVGASQKREVYRSQQNMEGEAGSWHEHEEEFTPKHSKFHPRWARVMLYAYYPPGMVDWDDVEVRLVKRASTNPR